VAQIDDILDGMATILETDQNLATIKKWHKVNGMIPSVHPTGSVSVSDEDFTEITQDKDDTTALFTIYLYLQHADPAAGEKQVRTLAHQVRSCLMKKENRDLGGLALDVFIKKIEYLTVDASKTELLHAAEITCQVQYFSPKILT
jgi:hypothetical protein